MGELGTEDCCTQTIYVQSKNIEVLDCGQRSVATVTTCGPIRAMSHDLHVVARFLHCKTTTMNVNFRKIDVDAYDEDVLLETELYDPDPRGPQQVIDDAKAKAASVRTSLAK